MPYLQWDENPLLLNVIKDAIPTMTEEHAVLLRSFNAFRSNAIRVLQSNSKGKLDCLQQALSLNGILHLQEDDNAIYRINQATWNELMLTYKSQFHSDPFTSSEKEQIAEMTEEFGDACKDGGDLGNVVEEMSSRRSSNMTPNVRRCLNMMRNLAELLNSSWSPKELTEDSLTVNLYDPIASAFLGKIESSLLWK